MIRAVTTPSWWRERWLFVAAVLPAVLYGLIRFLGFFSYLKLAGILAAAMVCALVPVLRPRWGLLFVTFYLYAGLGFYFPFNLAGVITIIVLLTVVLELVMGGENRLTDPLFWYSNALFFLIALGSMLWAIDPRLSIHELVDYLKVLSFVLLTVQLVRTPQQLRAMMYVIFAGALGTVVFGIMNLVLGIQSVGDNYIHGSEYMLRFMGTHENPNRAAAFMCTGLPMGIFAVKHARRAFKPFLILAVGIVVVAIYATFSRSVAFPLAVIAVAVLIREVRGRRSFLVVAALVVVAATLAPDVWRERVLGLGAAFQTTTLDWSVYTRLLALHTAWEMFLAHPFTGIGIGNFIVAAAYKVFIRIVVHNSYLEILVGTGVFGLLALFFVMYSGLRHTIRGYRARWKSSPPWMRSACFYCGLSAVSIWMSSFFGTMPFRQPFWIPIATGLVIANLLRQDREASSASAS